MRLSLMELQTALFPTSKDSFNDTISGNLESKKVDRNEFFYKDIFRLFLE